VLRVRIRTKVPREGIAKMYPDAILRLRCVCRGEKGIKALIDLKRPDGKTFLVIDEYECPLARKILDSGAMVTSAEVRGDEVVWNIVCSERAFKRLMESVECELISKEVFSEEDVLTFREYEMLKFAFERGYFDSPKRIGLEDLARFFDCSKSTASETLRRALTKVLRSYFEVG